MEQLQITVETVRPTAILPEYGTPGAACFDLFAAKVIEYTPNTILIATGLKFDIPEGWGMRIYSRSGHGFKNFVRLVNCTGIIDSDYTGEVMVKLVCDKQVRLGEETAIGELMRKIDSGDKVAVAQAEIFPVEYVTFAPGIVDKLTDRGAGGFGSTDKKAGA